MINKESLVIVLLFIAGLMGGCECKSTTNLASNKDTIEAIRQEFYEKYNSIYRNVGGDIWIFPVDGQYRMAEPQSSIKDRDILERYQHFIEIRGWNSDQEDIELTPDNMEEVLNYCIKNAQ